MPMGSHDNRSPGAGESRLENSPPPREADPAPGGSGAGRPDVLRPDSPNLGNDWPRDGEDLDADPDSIRGFAENIRTLAGNLGTNLQGNAHFITGDGVRLDDGGFPPGVTAEHMATAAAGRMLEAIKGSERNLTALTMASLACADVIGDADHRSALGLNTVNWAFADPTARTPAGLPSYLDGKTMQEHFNEHQDGGGETELVSTRMVGVYVIKTFRMPDGSVQTVRTNTLDGSERITVVDSGTLRSQTVIASNGTATTTHFHGDGAVRQVEKTYTTRSRSALAEQDKHHHASYDTDRITETYDADGNLESRQVTHTVRYFDDGSWKVGSKDDDGNFLPDRHFDAPSRQTGQSDPHGLDVLENQIDDIKEQVPSSD